MLQQTVQEILSIIEKVPHLAMWILVGIFLYKVIWVGSMFGVIRLAINTAYKIYEKKKEPVVEVYDIGGYFIQGKGLRDEFLRIISDFKKSSQHPDSKLNYIHGNDVEWFRQAVREKHERDTQGEKK